VNEQPSDVSLDEQLAGQIVDNLVRANLCTPQRANELRNKIAQGTANPGDWIFWADELSATMPAGDCDDQN
jgi:hypothetical protein